MIPAPAWTPANADYHADHSRWSPSMLKLFAEDPYTAFRRYILGEPNDEPPSVPMVIGSAVNTLLLESELASEIYVVETDGRGAKAYKEARATYPERLVMTRKEFVTAQGVASAILEPRTRSAEVARALLCGSGGYSEWAHQWVDSFGIRRKCKLDRARPIGNRPFVVELKSSFDPSPEGFPKTADQNGYDVQAAHNVEGLSDACGGELPGFIFVVVRNEPPHEVNVCAPDDRFFRLGRRKLARILSDLSGCLGDATGATWAKPWERMLDGKIPEMTSPSWAGKDY